VESDVNVDVCPSKYRHDDVIRETGSHDLRRHHNVSAAHSTRQDDYKRLASRYVACIRLPATIENHIRLGMWLGAVTKSGVSRRSNFS